MDIHAHVRVSSYGLRRWGTKAAPEREAGAARTSQRRWRRSGPGSASRGTVPRARHVGRPGATTLERPTLPPRSHGSVYGLASQTHLSWA
eukprot:scaffold29246_cov66-Phaeocystis_antarctica.AAC.2